MPRVFLGYDVYGVSGVLGHAIRLTSVAVVYRNGIENLIGGWGGGGGV